MLRIVSLAPNVTSILFALGASRELVGVSKWCKEVAPVGRRPQVGDCWKMDVRDVMRLQADSSDWLGAVCTRNSGKHLERAGGVPRH